MSSKPTPLFRFLPLELFFMRLPSSSSLLLASLAVSSSSSSSSLSALAAPAGDGPESLSSPAPIPPPVPPPVPSHPPVPPHASVPHGSDDMMVQPNGYLHARNMVDKVTAPLPPDVAKVIKGITDLIGPALDPIIGKDAPKARGGPLGVVNHLVSGKTLRADGADEVGVDDASEGSSSHAANSTSPAAGTQDPPVADPNPPASCPSQSSPRSDPVRRQAPAASDGDTKSPGSLDPEPTGSPPPPGSSGSGGDVAVNSGEDVNCPG